MTLSFCPLADDARLAYQDEGSGPPVVFVHGVGADMETWDGVVDILAADWRTVRYDLRGHGRSSRVPPDGMQSFAADHAALLDHLRLPASHLIGFSLGGLIAQALALQAPDRIRRLVLISTTAGRTEIERQAAMQRAAALAQGGGNAHVEAALQRWFTDDFRRANPATIEHTLARGQRNDPRCYAAAYRVLAESDYGEQLAQITASTLIITGEEDVNSTARMARLMAARIPCAELEIYAGLRHALLAECPQRVAKSVHDFLIKSQTSADRP